MSSSYVIVMSLVKTQIADEGERRDADLGGEEGGLELGVAAARLERESPTRVLPQVELLEPVERVQDPGRDLTLALRRHRRPETRS